MKEYVNKWNASQKEVDANTQQEVEVPEDVKKFCNLLSIEVDRTVDDSENVDDSKNDEEEDDVFYSEGFFM